MTQMSQGAPVEPLSESDEKMWAMLGQLSGLVLGFLGPLVVMLVFGPRSKFVRSQSVEALNFQITLVIAYFISMLLTLVVIGVFLLLAVWICSLVFSVLAAMANNAGQEYRYPFALRLVS